ncbi:MAG: 50S ribosomal protein L11 methyltransferase [Chitinophagales bacterium]|nr:50S ribosomal protein L11 methyltransferase [Chitinophagales bacterium]
MPAEWISCRIEVTEDQQEQLMVLLLACGFVGFEQRPDCLIAYGQPDDLKAFPPQKLSEYCVQVERIPDRNWNGEWEKQYQPVYAGKVYLRAPHHPPDPKAAMELIIEPSMAFGTGHHATTRLCLLVMEHMDLSGKAVLDFGCGTGVLAIYAALRGAQVTAVDSDANAVACALENCRRNRVEHQITVLQGNTVPGDLLVDVVLANIDLQTLLLQLESMVCVLKPEGILILSGFLPSDAERLEAKAAETGAKLTHWALEENWMVIVFTRNQKDKN